MRRTCSAVSPGRPVPFVRVDDQVPYRVWVSQASYWDAKRALVGLLRSARPDGEVGGVEVEVLP